MEQQCLSFHSLLSWMWLRGNSFVDFTQIVSTTRSWQAAQTHKQGHKRHISATWSHSRPGDANLSAGSRSWTATDCRPLFVKQTWNYCTQPWQMPNPGEQMKRFGHLYILDVILRRKQELGFHIFAECKASSMEISCFFQYLGRK